MHMELDRLKESWQQREGGATPDAAGEAARIAARLAAWRRQVRRRDYRECGAAVVCTLIFGRLAFVLPSATARAAAAFLVVSSVIIAVRLIRANPGRQQIDRSVSVRQFCENELQRIDAQIALLRAVPFWYVGPVLIGANVLFAALSPRLAWTLAYLFATLIFGGWVCYINRQAVRKKLIPLRDDLVRILGEQS